jgi:type I restriction enzyme S subunit
MKAFRLHDTEDHLTREGAENGTRIARVGTTLLLVRGMTLLDDIPICVPMREMAFNQDVKALVPGGSVDGAFLAYWLVANTPTLLNLVDTASHGTGRINTEALKTLEVRLPPPELQGRIANVLSMIDDKIELNRRMNQTLEAIARAIFKSWFVDFDPVRAKAERRKPLVPPELVDLFPSKLADSPIGPVPEGWDVAPLGEHVEVVRGLSYRSADLVGEGDGLPLHNLNSIFEGGGYKYDGIKWYAGEYRERDLVEPGDVIVANAEQGHDYLLIGCPAIVPRSFDDGSLFSADLFCIRPRAISSFTRRFVYSLFSEGCFRQVVTAYTNGTTVNHLSIDGLRRPRVAVPPRELVAAFDRIVTPIFEQGENLEDESHTLAHIRDSLLPPLSSGRIRLATAAAVSPV